MNCWQDCWLPGPLDAGIPLLMCDDPDMATTSIKSEAGAVPLEDAAVCMASVHAVLPPVPH
jgi:hypothetical protein